MAQIGRQLLLMTAELLSFDLISLRLDSRLRSAPLRSARENNGQLGRAKMKMPAKKNVRPTAMVQCRKKKLNKKRK